MQAIQTFSLKKYFYNGEYEVRAVDKVNLSVEEGEFVAIMGNSGSGKSTLLNLLGGLDEATEGEILIRGESLRGMEREERTIFRRRNIGFVFQQYNLVTSLSVYENIVLPLCLDGLAPDEAFLNHLVELLKIGDKLYEMPERLSGGQQQRAAIARALITHPAIVLADEPTGNLDSATSMEVAGLLKTCARQFDQTVIMVTHDKTVARTADRILLMKDGVVQVADDVLSTKDGVVQVADDVLTTKDGVVQVADDVLSKEDGLAHASDDILPMEDVQ